jgi:hypothetical protein
MGIGQEQVEEHDFGQEAVRDLDGDDAVDGVLDLVAHLRQQQGQHPGAIDVVFDDQHAPLDARLGLP